MKFPALLLLLSLLLLSTITPTPAASVATQQISRGFTATPDPSSPPFQPLLTDHTGVFSLGFLRVDSTHLVLAILHLPSYYPVWRAILTHPARWAGTTTLSFNGSLALSDAESGILWVAASNNGDRLILLNTSNLQLQSSAEPLSILWQSFDFPSDTLVQDQNFTSTTTLISANQLYSMKVGTNYLGLHMGISDSSPMYWKHTALEAKAQIIDGKGPVYARVDPLGFLGMYQNEKGPVDVLAFDTFNRAIPGLRRLTLEHDGNLQAYYWNSAAWVTEYTAVTEACGLPCGPYRMCHAGAEPQCGCLDNRTDSCFPEDSGDLCGGDYWVLRREGVELANKELLPFVKLESLDECEKSCELNCSCWGAVYNNASRFCYRMDYLPEMVVAVDGEGKSGYFKVRTVVGSGGRGGRRVGTALLVACAVIGAGGVGFGTYRIWRRRKGAEGSMEEGVSVGRYKDLSSSSFRSVELTNSFRK